MISLSKKVDYALISLAHLVSNPDRVASAREIGQLHGLPVPLVMNILKRLHQQGVLSSTRGVKGGYQIAIDLDELSLAQLIEIVEAEHEPRRPMRLSLLPPVQGLQFRLMRLLRQLCVTDLVKPGRRIDVPLELVRVAKEQTPAPVKLPA